MNCNTGELRRISEGLNEEEKEAFLKNFTPVPNELSKEAEKELGNREQVFVNMEKDTPLVNWAKLQQIHKGPNRKQRRKMAKENRRKNRK